MSASFARVMRCERPNHLRPHRPGLTMPDVWNEPYLETCCRSALHRLVLSGAIGRPGGMKDGPCLVRLGENGLARVRSDGRYGATETGRARHAREILRASEPLI